MTDSCELAKLRLENDRYRKACQDLSDWVGDRPIKIIFKGRRNHVSFARLLLEIRKILMERKDGKEAHREAKEVRKGDARGEEEAEE